LTQKSKGSGLETWYYGYDNADRLTSVRQTSDGTTNELTVTYTYDVLGNRVQQDKWKTGGSTVTTRFAYDGLNVWADLDGSNNLQVRYLYGDETDQILARTEASGQPNPGVAWYLTDQLGSVRDLENGSSQAVGDHLDYDGFGNTTESTPSYGDRYKFTGREADADTKLQYNRARYYDPTTGRWVRQDPIGFAAGDVNLYRYVADDPVNSNDPLGLQTGVQGNRPQSGGNSPQTGVVIFVTPMGIVAVGYYIPPGSAGVRVTPPPMREQPNFLSQLGEITRELDAQLARARNGLAAARSNLQKQDEIRKEKARLNEIRRQFKYQIAEGQRKLAGALGELDRQIELLQDQMKAKTKGLDRREAQQIERDYQRRIQELRGAMDAAQRHYNEFKRMMEELESKYADAVTALGG
jgi:RHS repeat-associated protein